MSEKVEVRGRVPSDLYDDLVRKTPGGESLSDGDLLTYWLTYAHRQYHLEELRATGQWPGPDAPDADEQ